MDKLLEKKVESLKIDVFYFFIIQIIVSIFVGITTFNYDYYHSLSSISQFFFFNSFFILLVLKDIFDNGSIGKKNYGLKVVKNDGTKASIWLLIIRNLTFFILPLEVLFYFYQKRRIGDLIAGTKVIEVDSNHSIKILSTIKFLFIILIFSTFLEFCQYNIFEYNTIQEYFYIDKFKSKELNEKLNHQLQYLATDIYVNVIDKKNEKLIKMKMSTKKSYFLSMKDKAFFQEDWQYIKGVIANCIDTTDYQIEIDLIGSSNTKKTISTFYINKK